MTGTALTPALPGSVGKNGTTANAISFDQDGEVDNIRVRGMFGAPPATAAKTVTYAVTVPAGGEVKVASAATGPAFFISAGTAIFAGITEVVITV